MPMNAVADVSREPDAQDFEAIFRQLSPMVYRTARALTGRPEEAEDIVQAIFLKLIERELPVVFRKDLRRCRRRPSRRRRPRGNPCHQPDRHSGHNALQLRPRVPARRHVGNPGPAWDANLRGFLAGAASTALGSRAGTAAWAPARAGAGASRVHRDRCHRETGAELRVTGRPSPLPAAVTPRKTSFSPTVPSIWCAAVNVWRHLPPSWLMLGVNKTSVRVVFIPRAHEHICDDDCLGGDGCGGLEPAKAPRDFIVIDRVE